MVLAKQIRAMEKLLHTSVLCLLLVSVQCEVWGQGTGTIKYSDGSTYIGELRDNQRNGHGTLTTVSGNVYVGEFRDNQANGQGTYTYANGNVYVGEFRDNLFNGHGILTYTDGRAENGIWRNNEFVNSANTPPIVESELEMP